jgi:hypothetical protein
MSCEQELEGLKREVAVLKSLLVWLERRLKKLLPMVERRAEDLGDLVATLGARLDAKLVSPLTDGAPVPIDRGRNRFPRPSVPLRGVELVERADGQFNVIADGTAFVLPGALGHLLAILGDPLVPATPDGSVGYKPQKWVKVELARRTKKERTGRAFNQLVNRLRREMEAQGLRGYVETGAPGYRLFTRRCRVAVG